MSEADLSRRGARVREFLDKLYWVLGVFCAVWAASVFIGVLRRQPLSLPVFGSTQLSEMIIFTQIAFCVLLPLLLLIVGIFQFSASKWKWETYYPGTPADAWEIPKSFGWLRVIIFLALVIFPVAMMDFCFARMVEEMKMVINNAPEVKPPNVADPRDRPLHGGALFTFGPKATSQGNQPDWRWAGADIQLPKDVEPARISAAPGLEPSIFIVFCIVCSTAALYFLISPAFAPRIIPTTRPPVAL